MKPISDAMARRLCVMWAERSMTNVGEGMCDPTNKALIDRGLLVKSGVIGRWGNGPGATEFEGYRLSVNAPQVLAQYMAKRFLVQS
jgi:hypothetical protein